MAKVKKYKVVNQVVEIGGERRQIGDIIDASMFNPAPELTEEQIVDGLVATTEIESLLSTGHIILND